MSILAPIAVALAAAGAFAAYVSARQRRAILATRNGQWGTIREPAEHDEHADEYERYAALERTGTTALDDRTWADLDLGRVLASIDRTQTTIGRQVLYSRLRTGGASGDSAELERLATLFGGDASARERAQTALGGIDPTTGQGYWRITQPGAIRRQWWFYLFPVLALAAPIAAFAIVFWPPALLVLLGVAIANASFRAATSRQIIGVRGAFRQVAPVLRTAERLHAIPAVAATDDPSRQRADIAADIAVLADLRRIASWMSRDPLQVGEFVATLYEYFNLLLLLDANALLFGARALERHRAALTRVSAWAGAVDVALTIASLRAEPRRWSIPQFTGDDTPADIRDAWHPMLANPVPNSVTLSGGAGIVLTGSNMSGKSTFLRTIGVCAVLGEALNTCPAASFTGPRLHVRTCIGRSDDIASGTSYYLAEVEAVMALLRASTEPGAHLFLFDELFRGTNTIERLAAGESVLRELLASRHNGTRPSVIVATHDGELVAMLQGLYEPFHFRETITTAGLEFDFQIRPGPATTRSALALLELNGAAPRLLERARRRAAELDQRAADSGRNG